MWQIYNYTLNPEWSKTRWIGLWKLCLNRITPLLQSHIYRVLTVIIPARQQSETLKTSPTHSIKVWTPREKSIRKVCSQGPQMFRYCPHPSLISPSLFQHMLRSGGTALYLILGRKTSPENVWGADQITDKKFVMMFKNEKKMFKRQSRHSCLPTFPFVLGHSNNSELAQSATSSVNLLF